MNNWILSGKWMTLVNSSKSCLMNEYLTNHGYQRKFFNISFFIITYESSLLAQFASQRVVDYFAYQHHLHRTFLLKLISRIGNRHRFHLHMKTNESNNAKAVSSMHTTSFSIHNYHLGLQGWDIHAGSKLKAEIPIST